MLHLDRHRPRFHYDGVGDEVGFPVPSNGDHVRELKEGPDHLFPELGVPLKQGRRIQAEVSHQPLNLTALRESVEGFVDGSLGWWRSLRVDGGRSKSDFLHRPDDRVGGKFLVHGFQVVGQDGQGPVGLHLLDNGIVAQQRGIRRLEKDKGAGGKWRLDLQWEDGPGPFRDLPTCGLGLVDECNLNWVS